MRKHLTTIGIVVLLSIPACIDGSDASSGGTHSFTVLFQRDDVPTMDFAYGSLNGHSHDLLGVGFQFEDGAGMSPDGKWMAYPTFHMDPDAPRLTLAALDDSGAAEAVIPGGMAHMPTWSPDGTKVAFARSVFDGGMVGQIGVFVADASPGGTTIQLDLLPIAGHPAKCIAPVWSPDGQRIAYSTQNSVSVYSFEDRAVHVLLLPDWALWTCGPRWSPDGTSIVYATIGADGVRRIQRIAPTANSYPTDVAPLESAAGVSQIRWSPDGATLAYTEVDTAASAVALRRVDAAGGIPTTLATLASEIALGPPEWSPDGRMLLYSYFDDEARLATISAEGGTPEVLPLPVANSSYYAWLPAPIPLLAP